MLLSEFDFPFDPSLVADRPVEPRDHARLLLLPPGEPSRHHRILELPALLDPGDLLVVNDTRVIPACLTGFKRPGGGKVDVLFVKEVGENRWHALLKNAGKVGQIIDFPGQVSCEVLESGPGGTILSVSAPIPFRDVLAAAGQIPLPPYIRRAAQSNDRIWYQTIFARDEGAIAAPTAGLHFTERLVAALRDRGVRLTAVTLHVGPGTFRPVTVDRIEDHRMDPERVEVSEEAAEAIASVRSAGGRVVAVGTTVVRTLEGVRAVLGTVAPYTGETNLFITPGYRFRVVDALLTNFHLPRSTLLMLTAAFAGLDQLRRAYQAAVEERYRFYSYGDAMLIVGRKEGT